MGIRRSLLWCGALAVLLLPFFSSADAWVFVHDDRVPSHHRTVGRLVSEMPEGRSSGTAFLVDDCGILTNFHVVFGSWTVTVLRPPSHEFETTFTLTEVKLPDGSHPTSKAYPAAWGDYIGPDRQMRLADQDWVYLALDSCLGETYGHLTPVVAREELHTTFDYRFTAIGYSGGRQQEDPDCRMSASDDVSRRKAMGHDCVMLAGDSGGPILKQGTTSVVAIGSGFLGGNGSLACQSGEGLLVRQFRASCSNLAVGMSSQLVDQITETGYLVKIQMYLSAMKYDAGMRGNIEGSSFLHALAEFRRDYSVPESVNACMLSVLLRMRANT